MKETFYGYYPPSKKGFEDLWENCFFVLDANVLLNLYRYSPEARETFIRILDGISDRIWVPHQVALEYQENRLSEVARQEKVYEKVSDTLQKALSDLEALLSRGHPSIDVEGLLERIKGTFTEIEEELEKDRGQHPDLFTDDDIRSTITFLLERKVGPPYDQERLLQIYECGRQRYENEVPPGYKDTKEGVKRYGNLVIEDKYGDLILWRQIIDKAKEAQKPVILITDETKEDWWWKFQGKTIGPRSELITEMRTEAEVPFYMYTPNRFMYYAQTYLDVRITAEVIDEVRDVSEETTWKEEVFNALKALGGKAYLSDIYDYIERNASRELPESWRPIIRRTLQNYCSESIAFIGPEDLFVHLGKGHWGMKDVEP